MSDDSVLDAEIIRTAYAEKVKEAFKMFAENIAVGQSENSCRERFVRSLDLMRRARDLAVEASSGPAVADASADSAVPAPAADPGAGLSEADRQMIEHALSGTTGHKAPPPPPSNPRYR